ncbi:unnamed protein product [Hymenolepis diminuta]|uniref:Uncharacterized protein n=1 Tax=Hymenolepis diminuta TaxID=6216 RepID=A0A564YN38_HYMDI|nr:unnamed protein product [Hymenolepis diminuta]
MAAYVKGFPQFSSSAGWIFISSNLRLLIIKLFEHPALGSSFRLKASFFIHNIVSRCIFEDFCCRGSLMKLK